MKRMSLFLVALRKLPCRVEERERARPLRIGGRLERCHRATVMRTQEDSAGRADRIEHGTDVVHPRLERGKVAAEIGEAGPPLVEQDQSERLRELFVEAPPMRRLLAVNKVREIVGDLEQIGLAVTDDLVRDRHAAAPGVANIRVHGNSFVDFNRGDNGGGGAVAPRA